MLFVEKKMKRPAYGPRKCLRDLVSNNFKILGIDEWYELCQDRDCWYKRYQEEISQLLIFAENICCQKST